jgi:hypothetical protein
VSLIQNRNRNVPAVARLGLSNTTWYVPGLGWMAPEAGVAPPNSSTYGLRLTGSAGYPVRRFSSPAATIRGSTREPGPRCVTTTPKFATRPVTRTRNTCSGPASRDVTGPTSGTSG